MKVEVEIDVPRTGIGKVDSQARKHIEGIKEKIATAIKGISDISEISNVATRLFSFEELAFTVEGHKTVHRFTVDSVGTTLINQIGKERPKVIRRYKYRIEHASAGRYNPAFLGEGHDRSRALPGLS